MPDTDLDNDRVKLVRYHVVTILRGHERILESRHRLVTGPMTADAFVAWVTAELEDRGGLPPDADRFLRVTWEVLESWPKQDLKYEEKQLRLLEGIASTLGGGDGVGGEYRRLVDRLRGRRDLLGGWRRSLAKAGKRLSDGIAEAFNSRRETGAFALREITGAELRAAFRGGVAAQRPFNNREFDQFAGTWKRTLYTHDLHTGEELAPPDVFYDVWEPTREIAGGRVQRIAGAQDGPISPDSLPPLSENRVDLVIDYYDDDLGASGYASNYRKGRQEIPLIAYVLDDEPVHRYLWICQVFDGELEHSFPPDVYGLFYEYCGEHEGQRAFFLAAINLRIDSDWKSFEIFDAGGAFPFFFKILSLEVE